MQLLSSLNKQEAKACRRAEGDVLERTKTVRISRRGLQGLAGRTARCFHSTAVPDLPRHEASPGFCLGLSAHLPVDMYFHKEMFGFHRGELY